MSVLNLDQIFVTADLHIGHGLLADIRGFNCVREHDEELVRRWNEAVVEGSTAYLLGDVGFRCSPGYLSDVLGRMAGRMFLLRGNHDGPATKPACRGRFEQILDVLELKGRCSHRLAGEQPIKVWMSHYAHLVWPSSNHGSFHLYGHSHGKLPWSPQRSLDVGIDGSSLRPLTLRGALDRIEQRLSRPAEKPWEEIA